MFGLQELCEGLVVYSHSDSDSTRDHVVFRISDGRHSIRHRFPIRILPKDDSPPALLVHLALQVREGGAVRLGPESLLASDLDSSDDLILYRVETPPTTGQLVRRSSAHDPGKGGGGTLVMSLMMSLVMTMSLTLISSLLTMSLMMSLLMMSPLRLQAPWCPASSRWSCCRGGSSMCTRGRSSSTTPSRCRWPTPTTHPTCRRPM